MTLFAPLTLPCGAVLRNRLAKAAMSDSLGDGAGQPTDAQRRLYQRWAEGGAALAVIGEVQTDPHAAEKPGNLVLRAESDLPGFSALAAAGSGDGAHLWPQLGHAGALTHPPIGRPVGPSALDLPGLSCAEMSAADIAKLPDQIAGTAALAQEVGFTGVELHAAHGFLLSQFLSPLFNRRGDRYGGPIAARMRIVLEVIDAVRAAVGPGFAVALKLNATDQLEGGLTSEDALAVVAALDASRIDLLDISGGTYFPGAASASDAGGGGAYFLDFARAARSLTDVPLMLTGGVKRRAQAEEILSKGAVDVLGLARGFALWPDLPARWRAAAEDPSYPRFAAPPEGGVTAWYTMRLTEIGEDREAAPAPNPKLAPVIAAYEERDTARCTRWRARYG